jgi:hypothetical protein
MSEYIKPPTGKPISQVQDDMERREAHPAKGWSSLSLCLARVLEIQWEEMRCTIEILAGQGDYTTPYSGVELLMPSMGNRHFMGGIPEIGDQCVVGWFVGDTSGSANNRTPAILAWWPSATYIGHDWIMTQDFAPDEGFDSSKEQEQVSNFYRRIRSKLRHYSPGNIGASSSQGADMVLDESVTLSNRRANEIILRDQDQAIVLRSLQQFHAMGGARVYAGMVQRDARSLPKEMFSDGIKWDSAVQIDADGNPFNPFDEGFEESTIPYNQLDPHPLFSRGEEAGSISPQGEISGSQPAFDGSIPPNLDPYRFLYRAGLVDDQFYDSSNTSLASTYGGKSTLRVGAEYGKNAIEEGEAFTEYRIELSHTHDGVLPVTEQTDGFDSDKLPGERGKDRTRPYIEWVLGTPAGNNPFGSEASLYGIPLVPKVSAEEAVYDGARDDTPFADHAATLLRVTPLVPDVEDSFVSWTKGGKFKANVSSPEDDAMVSRVEGGAQLFMGSLQVESGNTRLKSSGATEMEVGALSISATSANDGAPLEGDSNQVSVSIKGRRRISLQSDTAISLKAPIVDLSEAGEVRLSSSQQMSFSTGSGLSLSAQNVKQTATGSMDITVTGPPDFNAAHGAVRKTTIGASPATGHAGGTSDSYINTSGGRSEIYLGVTNNIKAVSSGTETRAIGAGGVDTLIVGENLRVIDPTGFKFASPSGSIIATAGNLISLTSNTIFAKGVSLVSMSAPSVLLGSPGASFGPIVCGSDIHPILGVPFSTFCPPRGQNLVVMP